MSDARRQWGDTTVPETVNGWQCIAAEDRQLQYVKDDEEATILPSAEGNDLYRYIVTLPSPRSVITYDERDAAINRLIGYLERTDTPDWFTGDGVPGEVPDK